MNFWQKRENAERQTQSVGSPIKKCRGSYSTATVARERDLPAGPAGRAAKHFLEEEVVTIPVLYARDNAQNPRKMDYFAQNTNGALSRVEQHQDDEEDECLSPLNLSTLLFGPLSESVSVEILFEASIMLFPAATSSLDWQSE